MREDGLKLSARLYRVQVGRYAQAGRLDEMRRLLQEMDACGCTGDVVMWTQCVAAFGRGVYSVAPAFGSFSPACIRLGIAGDLDAMESMVARMRLQRIAPNRYTYTAMVRAYARAARRDKVTELWTLVKKVCVCVRAY